MFLKILLQLVMEFLRSSVLVRKISLLAMQVVYILPIQVLSATIQQYIILNTESPLIMLVPIL